MNLLQVAYAANVIILTPVLLSMFGDGDGKPIRAFQGQVENSDGLRLLVASLWSAILLLSVAGMFAPERFTPVLWLQVVYKLCYLCVYIAPTVLRKGLRYVPCGISFSFAVIVITWPILIAFH